MTIEQSRRKLKTLVRKLDRESQRVDCRLCPRCGEANPLGRSECKTYQCGTPLGVAHERLTVQTCLHCKVTAPKGASRCLLCKDPTMQTQYRRPDAPLPSDEQLELLGDLAL